MTLTLPTADELRITIPTLSAKYTDDQLTQIIADSSMMIEQCAVIEAMAAEKQKAVVRYVSAHLAMLQSGSSGVMTSKTIGDASEGYASAPLGPGLKSTYYGQQALMLEPSGCLARVGLRSISFDVVN